MRWGESSQQRRKDKGADETGGARTAVGGYICNAGAAISGRRHHHHGRQPAKQLFSSRQVETAACSHLPLIQIISDCLFPCADTTLPIASAHPALKFHYGGKWSYLANPRTPEVFHSAAARGHDHSTRIKTPE